MALPDKQAGKQAATHHLLSIDTLSPSPYIFTVIPHKCKQAAEKALISFLPHLPPFSFFTNLQSFFHHFLITYLLEWNLDQTWWNETWTRHGGMEPELICIGRIPRLSKSTWPAKSGHSSVCLQLSLLCH